MSQKHSSSKIFGTPVHITLHIFSCWPIWSDEIWDMGHKQWDMLWHLVSRSGSWQSLSRLTGSKFSMRNKSENLETLRMKTNMMKRLYHEHTHGQGCPPVRSSPWWWASSLLLFTKKLYLGRGFLREEARLDKTIKMLFHPKIKHCWLFRWQL